MDSKLSGCVVEIDSVGFICTLVVELNDPTKVLDVILIRLLAEMEQSSSGSCSDMESVETMATELTKVLLGFGSTKVVLDFGAQANLGLIDFCNVALFSGNLVMSFVVLLAASSLVPFVAPSTVPHSVPDLAPFVSLSAVPVDESNFSSWTLWTVFKNEGSAVLT